MTVKPGPPRGKRRSAGRGNFDPKSVTPAQRVREVPDEQLCVSAGKLFCKACREELSTKLSILKGHIKTKKHADGVKRREAKEIRERDIARSLKAHDESHPRGETLPIDQRVYRVKVVTFFLRAGVPLSKLESFRDILEEHAYRLTDRHYTGMSDLVPFILTKEQAKIKQEIEGKDVSVIFDGTTRLGEAMAVVIRFVDNEWKIEQRLLTLKMLAKSMTGEEIARELVSVISTSFSISSNQLLAGMRDRASVNDVAMRTIKILYPHMVDVGCFSHTIDHVGEHFKTPILDSFVSSWVKIFSHSPKARLLWKEQTGRSMATFSVTRWWSKWEVIKQLLEQFGDIRLFLSSEENFASVLKPKLLAVLENAQQNIMLQLEMAATVDAGEPFVKATYHLEGDGPLAFECFEVITMLQASISNNHYPNVIAVARQLSTGNSTLTVSHFTQYAQNCIQPGLQYFTTQLGSSLKVPLAAFRAARLLNPQKVAETLPNASAVDELSSFPFVTTTMLSNFKAELPSYIAKADGIDPTFCRLRWWKNNSSSLPHWSALARQVLLVQPSSAAAERVFSLLANSFGDQQNNALQDYVETSIMLQYNKH